MMMKFKMISNDGNIIVYSVDSDGDLATVTINKKTKEVKATGKVSIMFSLGFVESMMENALKKNSFLDEFVYGVG